MCILCTFVSLSIHSTTLTFISTCPEHEKNFFKIRFIHYDHSYYKDFQNKISVKTEYFHKKKKTLKKPSESNLEEEKI